MSSAIALKTAPRGSTSGPSAPFPAMGRSTRVVSGRAPLASVPGSAAGPEPRPAPRRELPPRADRPARTDRPARPAAAASPRRIPVPPPPALTPRRREATGIGLLALGLFLLLSTASLVLGSGALMGPVGLSVAGGAFALCGLLSIALSGGLLLLAVRCLRAEPLRPRPLAVLGSAGITLAAAVLLHLIGGSSRLHGMPLGGAIGEYAAEVLIALFGTAGTVLVALAGLTLALLSLTSLTITGSARWVAQHARRGFALFTDWLRTAWPQRTAPVADADADADADGAGKKDAAAQAALAPGRLPLPPASAVPGVPVIVADYGDDRDQRGQTGPRLSPRAQKVADKPAPRGEAEPKPLDGPDAPVIVARRKDEPVAAPAEAALAAIAAPAIIPAMPASPASPAAAADVADTEVMDAPPRGMTDEAASTLSAALPGEMAVTAARTAAAPPSAAVTPASGSGPVVLDPARARSASELAARAPRPEPKKPTGNYLALAETYRPPAISLFDYSEQGQHDLDRRAMLDLAQRLENTLGDYQVKGRVAAIHPGPVVTMYEFVPAPGIKLSKITALSSDLAMALEALRVRIVAPIPGKAAVGIEVPNRTRETVFLKEILADESFQQAKSKLSMALGKDISGAPVCVDLAKMPHLLVAGTTGSGKSVSVNGMVCSLLCNASPDEVKLIMIDPKMLELSIYEGIPHLLLPVVTDPKKANLALKWAVEEMDRRYDLISKSGVRDIGGYNKKVEKQLDDIAAAQLDMFDGDDGDDSGAYVIADKPKKLPYIVVLIDEFADLMMVASKEVETSVARIAQKARAAGIHLILATQRPSVDVITGLIKANFPSRIAFQVASRIDSRTILDAQGAENLLGMGDMLFTDRGQALRRIHGALVTDGEVHRVVEHLKLQGQPIYDMDILKPRLEDEEEAFEEDMSDELYDQAVRLVTETRQASISMVQRRLRIGYNRSARMIERMERDGIVSAADGAKGREVLAQNH